MTKNYWPMAKIKEKNGTIRDQFTYDSCSSLREALNVFETWSEFYHFNIIEAEIKEDIINKNGKKYTQKINVRHAWIAYTDEYTCIGDSLERKNKNERN